MTMTMHSGIIPDTFCSGAIYAWLLCFLLALLIQPIKHFAAGRVIFMAVGRSLFSPNLCPSSGGILL
jgi:hypothetical protein